MDRPAQGQAARMAQPQLSDLPGITRTMAPDTLARRFEMYSKIDPTTTGDRVQAGLQGAG